MAQRSKGRPAARRTRRPRPPVARKPGNPFERNEFADHLLETLPISIWVKNIDGVMLACNSRCAADFGQDKEKMIGRLSPEYRSAELRERAARTDREIVESGKAISYEARDARRDGSYRHAIVTKSPFFNADGSVGGIVGVITDITDRKRGEEALQLAAEVFEHSVEGIYLSNEDNRIVRINPAFTAITGYTIDEVRGKNPRMLGPIQGPEVFDEIWEALASDRIWRGEFFNRRKSGELFPVWATIIALGGNPGEPTRHIGIFHDITERKASENRMRWLAHHDFLTGLANRSLLEDRFDQALRRARRDNGRLALFLVDLNGFKPVNDAHGHQFGDLVLKVTAKRLLECVRQTDTVSRVGGDEFIIIASDINTRTDVEKLAQKIVAAICQPVSGETGNVSIGASVGACVYPDHGDSPALLQSLADAAMYTIKESGKTGFAIHGS
jgi:diguanylate cyclase (GGDEF)-like protein/PAS domain S-box-containing protein